MTPAGERTWLRYYGAVPASIDYPRITLYEAVAATAQALIDYCRERLIKWSCPREVEFRRELPKTRVGKIDFKVLVAEHVEKAKQ
jgi:long-chain acyl-CoA synthetase